MTLSEVSSYLATHVAANMAIRRPSTVIKVAHGVSGSDVVAALIDEAAYRRWSSTRLEAAA